jgi:hypothetical protein
MTSGCTLLSFLILLPLAASAQTNSQPAALILPPGTPLPVSIPDHLPMKIGQPIRAELLYPVYDHNKVVLPARTLVNGTIVSLTPDRTRRIHARLRLDFTPFHIPVVRFTSIVLPDGTTAPLSTTTATDGAPIYRLVAPPPRKGGFIAQQLDTVKQAAKDRIAVVTGPDKKDRFVQFVYSQFPYHPERIAKNTAWTAETAAPLPIPGFSRAPPPPARAVADDTTRPTWILQAYLSTPISSATSKPGEKISATVAEPILNPDGSVAVPQGSILNGEVTKARPSRSWGRAGQLSFNFRDLTFPGAEPQSVQAALTGTDGAADMAMNSEGEVKPKPKDKLVVPAILIGLALRPLDRDGGRHSFGKDAVASNSLGTIGFILGTAAQRPNLAAGLGFYGAAISIYERVLRRGKEVAFAKDTRVVLQTTPRRSAAIKPAVPPAP